MQQGTLMLSQPTRGSEGSESSLARGEDIAFLQSGVVEPYVRIRWASADG